MATFHTCAAKPEGEFCLQPQLNSSCIFQLPVSLSNLLKIEQDICSPEWWTQQSLNSAWEKFVHVQLDRKRSSVSDINWTRSVCIPVASQTVYFGYDWAWIVAYRVVNSKISILLIATFHACAVKPEDENCLQPQLNSSCILQLPVSLSNLLKIGYEMWPPQWWTRKSQNSAWAKFVHVQLNRKRIFANDINWTAWIPVAHHIV
jgi:hypothetical protein